MAEVLGESLAENVLVTSCSVHSAPVWCQLEKLSPWAIWITRLRNSHPVLLQEGFSSVPLPSQRTSHPHTLPTLFPPSCRCFKPLHLIRWMHFSTPSSSSWLWTSATSPWSTPAETFPELWSGHALESLWASPPPLQNCRMKMFGFLAQLSVFVTWQVRDVLWHCVGWKADPFFPDTLYLQPGTCTFL